MLNELPISDYPGIVFICFYILGFIAALEVIYKGRTAQGTIAWVVSLLLMPLLALPCYLIFGSRRFQGYIKARRLGNNRIDLEALKILECIKDKQSQFSAGQHYPYKAFNKLARLPFTGGNKVSLLINGTKTFEKMFEAIKSSKKTVLVQFYIIRDDDLGRKLKDLLITKAQQGIKIYFMCDYIGSIGLSRKYMQDLRQAGIDARYFKTNKHGTRLQINFRNHRKIVVCDGTIAFIGGHNVGDEYLKENWRDTHISIEGPGVKAVQLSFLEDWNWLTEKGYDLPDLSLDIQQQKIIGQGSDLIVLSSGPADHLETCALFFINAINSAKERLWIVSPYFVPDSAVMAALQSAALRGVNVKVLIPAKSDNWLVNLSMPEYCRRASYAGVKVFRYQAGMLHQKVFLVDDQLACVGTANLDNRSFRINFEISALVSCPQFSKQVEFMLEADFQKSEIDTSDHQRSFLQRTLSRIAYLFGPLQ